MRYEFTIALRYLVSKQSVREPTVIGLLTIAGLALSTGVMIIVLSVFAGFEGDLRTKILGTHAHVLVTGPDEDVLSNPSPILHITDQQPHVVGASPFVESEVMIASTTNYSGMVLRGLNIDQVHPSSHFAKYLTEGNLSWINDSKKAFSVRQGRQLNAGNPSLQDIQALQDQIEQTQKEIDHIRSQAKKGLDIHGNPLPVGAHADADPAEPDGRGERQDAPEDASEQHVDMRALPSPPGLHAARARNAENAPSKAHHAEDDDAHDERMPRLPSPEPQDDVTAQDAGGLEEEHGQAFMPALPSPSADASPSPPAVTADADDMPALPSPNKPTSPSMKSAGEGVRDLPGIVIGVELQKLLNVLIGDTVNIITPDGDLGPNGLIPRSRPYRIVGVFYTGFYQYDSGMGVVDIDAARSLLNIPEHEVTGIEVRTDDMRTAHHTAAQLQKAYNAAGLEPLEVQDWRQLNHSLFAALKLERVAMAAVLIFFIAISGLLVLLVVWMFVIEKRKEIAILKAVGATRGNIMRIFLTQGVTMGMIGAGLGLLLALGFVGVAVYVGIPLNPDQYYISRLPVEVHPWEFVLVSISALVVTVLATLFPAYRAANLDPVAGLRDDQDNN